MKRLTIEQIDNELLKLMDEQPEFNYVDNETPQGCYYTKGPTSDPLKCNGCIFGQAFQRLGISKETLDKDLNNYAIMRVRAKWLPKEIPEYWSQIQRAQDGGNPWGELKRFLPL